MVRSCALIVFVFIVAFIGVREFKLPPGEEGRLRFVNPWDEGDSFALIGGNCSTPWFIPNDSRKAVYFCTGGILRSLIDAADLLQKLRDQRGDKGKVSDVDEVEHLIMSQLQDNCARYVDSLSTEEKKTAYNEFPSLARGDAMATNFKTLYDTGVVARSPMKSSSGGLYRVQLVSALASAAVRRALARSVVDEYEPRSSFASSSAWGSELQKRVTNFFDPISIELKTISLDGSEYDALPVSVDYPVYFKDLSTIVSIPHKSIIFEPFDQKYPVDAIIVPKNPESPIILIEVSTMTPRYADRVLKCMKILDEGRLVDEIKMLFSEQKRGVVLLLCFDGDLGKVDINSDQLYRQLEAEALKKGMRIHVLDGTLLLNGLGLILQ